MRLMELTVTQQRVLEFINEFRGREQCNPTRLEISQHFGWASPNSAEVHLGYMEKKGVIERRRKSIGSGRYVVTPAYMETVAA